MNQHISLLIGSCVGAMVAGSLYALVERRLELRGIAAIAGGVIFIAVGIIVGATVSLIAVAHRDRHGRK